MSVKLLLLAAVGIILSTFNWHGVTAGTCSLGFLCGNVINKSGMDVLVVGHWCPDNLHRYEGNNLQCGGSAVVLPAGQVSAQFYKDTDGFRAPRGCITKYRPLWWGSFAYTEDRRGKEGVWIHVKDGHTWIINSIICG